MTPQQAALSESGLSGYRRLACGDASWLSFLYYECSQVFLSNLPGLLGFGLRALCYPSLFQACGARPAIGRGVVLRGPGAMQMGRKVMVDDYAALDAHGAGASIELGDYVSIGRFTSLVAKSARVCIEAAVNIGSYCRIASQSEVTIGESTLVAAYCYLGPGNHVRGNEATPLIAREMELKGGVHIGKHVWIGAGSTILDGVRIGDGAVIGAHSLVRSDVPAGATAVGAPARILPDS